MCINYNYNPCTWRSINSDRRQSPLPSTPMCSEGLCSSLCVWAESGAAGNCLPRTNVSSVCAPLWPLPTTHSPSVSYSGVISAFRLWMEPVVSFHKWLLLCGICYSVCGLFNLIQSCSSILLGTWRVSFLWLNNIALCYMLCFQSPVTRWNRLWLVPHFDYLNSPVDVMTSFPLNEYPGDCAAGSDGRQNRHNYSMFHLVTLTDTKWDI